MREKYKKIGLDYDLITSRFPDINEYETTVNCYLDDEFFTQLDMFIQNEDYALALDATKGLYILASELCLFPLYEALLEIYEDLEYEDYSQINTHLKNMNDTYQKIRGAFNA